MSYGPTVETRRQKHLVLILAREFASNLATATFISDAAGRLVYYNEPAERILGRTFAEAGEMPLGDEAAGFFRLGPVSIPSVHSAKSRGNISIMSAGDAWGETALTAGCGSSIAITVSQPP